MESFKAFNKRTISTSSKGSFQECIQDSNQNFVIQTKKHQFPPYQQKASFLRYASSLLEVGTEEQEKSEQIPIFEESQLINPPDSLIEKYESMKKEKSNHQILSCQIFPKSPQYQRKIEKGVLRLFSFIQQRLHKKHNLIQNKQPESLIDILALSSTENLTALDEKNTLYEAFHRVKQYSLKYHERLYLQKMSKPILPSSKKIASNNFQQKDIKNSLNQNKLILSAKRKEGTQHLAGILTFKVLFMSSQIFSVLKVHYRRQKAREFMKHLMKGMCWKAFHRIRQNFHVEPSFSRNDSKILTLSKSKSKTSLSKLKIHTSNSQKKISLKKFHSQEDDNLSRNADDSHSHFQERVINSEILQNFDFTHLKSRMDEDSDENQGKMTFNNKIKKKQGKESISQAETINSKRSIQSEYQFAQGVSSKVSSCKKAISVRNFGLQDEELLEQIPTEKMINVKKRKTHQTHDCKKNLFGQDITASKEIKPFTAQQRRYLKVRTNLFELPLQLQLHTGKDRKIVKKEQMNKIYHMMPDGLMKTEALQDVKDSLVMNVNSMNGIFGKNITSVQSEKKIDKYSDFIEKQQKKKRKITKEVDRMEQYYLNQQSANKNKKIYTEPKSPSSKQPQPNPSNKGLDQGYGAKKQKKSHKLKIKKSDNNFEAYYLSPQMKKNNGQGSLTERLNPQLSKVIRPANTKNHQTTSTYNLPHSKQQYEAEYKTSKLIRTENTTKNIKSLSPSVKFNVHEPYKTGKSGSKNLPGQSISTNGMFMHQKASIVTPSKIFSSTQNNNFRMINQLPVEPQSSGLSTPKSIHQFSSTGISNPSFIMQSKPKSKLKVFSTPRSLSPQQNNVVQHFFTSQNSDRKGSIIINGVQPVNMPMNRHMANMMPAGQSSLFTPTNSNLSNQPSINRVINYGPNLGFNQQMTNRPSSILSTHSNQSKEKKIIITKGPIISPRNVQYVSRPQVLASSPRYAPTGKAFVSDDGWMLPQQPMQARGLNVMMGGIQSNDRQSPNSSLSKIPSSVMRPKSNEKIFITMRK